MRFVKILRLILRSTLQRRAVHALQIRKLCTSKVTHGHDVAATWSEDTSFEFAAALRNKAKPASITSLCNDIPSNLATQHRASNGLLQEATAAGCAFANLALACVSADDMAENQDVDVLKGAREQRALGC